MPGTRSDTTYGPASVPSAEVGVANVPAAPVLTTVTAGLRSAIATWTPPADGGLPITSYRLTATPVGGGTARSVTVTSPTTTATVGSLLDNTAYVLSLTATNLAGTSAASLPSAPVTTTSGMPSTPTDVAATPWVRAASVSWTPSIDDGGAPLSGYRVTATPVAATVPPGVTAPVRAVTVTGDPPVSWTTISSLLSGVSYSITVTARNAAVSTYSAPSPPIVVRSRVCLALPRSPS